eukprot:scaffold1461_cov253-Pinguiococcus_pyrenoidosus.AAC.1
MSEAQDDAAEGASTAFTEAVAAIDSSPWDISVDTCILRISCAVSSIVSQSVVAEPLFTSLGMESNGRRSARRTQWRRVAKHSNPLRVIFATKKCGGLKFGFAPALQVHESFFRRFPADASAWKDLASWHIDQGASEEEVERVYEDAIHNCCDVDLWLTYVQFLIEAGGGEEVGCSPCRKRDRSGA